MAIHKKKQVKSAKTPIVTKIKKNTRSKANMTSGQKRILQKRGRLSKPAVLRMVRRDDVMRLPEYSYDEVRSIHHISLRDIVTRCLLILEFERKTTVTEKMVLDAINISVKNVSTL